MKGLGDLIFLIMPRTTTIGWVAHIKWFTDYPAYNGYPRTVIFHADDLMTVVDMGPAGARRSLGGQNKDTASGIGDLIGTPAPSHRSPIPMVIRASLALTELNRRAYKRIGMLGAGAMPYHFVTQLENWPCPARTARSEDAHRTGWMRSRRSKSDEEMTLVRRCAQMRDEVFACVEEDPAMPTPGMRDNTTSRRWRNDEDGYSGGERRDFSSARQHRSAGRSELPSIATCRAACCRRAIISRC